MSTSTGATPCRLATRAAKEPAIHDGPSLGRKRRESRDDRKLRTSRPGRLWLFTHSAAAPAGLTLAGLGFVSATPLFFTTTTEYLSKASAAGGIALISSLGNPRSGGGPVGDGLHHGGDRQFTLQHLPDRGGLYPFRSVAADNRQGGQSERRPVLTRQSML